MACPAPRVPRRRRDASRRRPAAHARKPSAAVSARARLHAHRRRKRLSSAANSHRCHRFLEPVAPFDARGRSTRAIERRRTLCPRAARRSPQANSPTRFPTRRSRTLCKTAPPASASCTNWRRAWPTRAAAAALRPRTQQPQVAPYCSLPPPRPRPQCSRCAPPARCVCRVCGAHLPLVRNKHNHRAHKFRAPSHFWVVRPPGPAGRCRHWSR